MRTPGRMLACGFGVTDDLDLDGARIDRVLSPKRSPPPVGMSSPISRACLAACRAEVSAIELRCRFSSRGLD
jgi:hypothetical protein